MGCKEYKCNRSVKLNRKNIDYLLAILVLKFGYIYIFDDLHSEDKSCQDFEARLRNKLGSYNKSNLDIDSFKDYIEEAVRRQEFTSESSTELATYTRIARL